MPFFQDATSFSGKSSSPFRSSSDSITNALLSSRSSSITTLVKDPSLLFLRDLFFPEPATTLFEPVVRLLFLTLSAGVPQSSKSQSLSPFAPDLAQIPNGGGADDTAIKPRIATDENLGGNGVGMKIEHSLQVPIGLQVDESPIVPGEEVANLGQLKLEIIENSLRCNVHGIGLTAGVGSEKPWTTEEAEVAVEEAFVAV
nr:hypothetical protein Itr_chr09CG17230 [Ipomoea trifida]